MMKKAFYCFVVASLLTLSINAQDHFTFKNIPIDGSITTFTSALESQGYTFVSSVNRSKLFEGKFIGKDALIVVSTNEDTQLVSGVVVMIDVPVDWSAIESMYGYVKNLLTLKYGAPVEVTENTEEDNILASLLTGQLTWESYWNFSNGVIGLQVDYDDSLGASIDLIYLDKINSNIESPSKYLEDL